MSRSGVAGICAVAVLTGFIAGRITGSGSGGTVNDTNDDARTDQRDHVFLFRGELASWISDLGQGVQAADVTRRGATTISIARDATVFFNGAGEAGRLMTSPIGAAVEARWKGGGDRVPNRGWITVPPPV